MSKKDYELIARTINALDQLGQEQFEYVAKSFATALESTNPRFDRKRFLEAAQGLPK